MSKRFSFPFKDSNGYGESIARLSNMLGGGVIDRIYHNEPVSDLFIRS